jgi:hypothetical protein
VRKDNKKQGLGQVIARRVLTQMGPELRQVAIAIGRPRRHPEGDWECPFMIEGLNEQGYYHTAGGVDALQALLMAVEGVRVSLERTGRRFFWLDREAGPDIPRYLPTQYGPRFEARLNRMIEQQAKRFWETRLKSRKANLAELEAEVKVRREVLATLEAALKKRRKAAADWEADLKSWKPGQRRGS